MTNDRPRVLHLPKWYPNRYDDQDGDFVARHVAAIAPHVRAAVVFAAVARGPLGQLIEEEVDLSGPVPTWRYYYRRRITGVGLIDKPLKLLLWLASMRRGLRAVRRHWQGQRPELVHAHILLRTGVLAWWLKQWWRVPYLITEQWTLYLPLRAARIGRVRRVLTRWVVRRAGGLHTVSADLQQAMRRLGFRNARAIVIANVVDTALFRPAAAPRVPGRLLVVSAFHDAVKNISGILRVVARLRPSLPQLHVRIAGYGPDEAALRQQAQDLNLAADGTVTFLGKLPHPAVAREMQQAAALVSFSRAETFGCIFLEARATGCPTVGPATGGVPELFRPEGAFGLLVPPDEEEKLASAIRAVVSGAHVFDAELLRADATQRCGYPVIGRQFAELYAAILADKY